MGARRKFSAEYTREAVAMLDAPGVTVSQIATDLGVGLLDVGDVNCVVSRSRLLWAMGAPGMKS
ncbi:hypothetical protein COMA2_130146 [Candidatus Nitrospira nitrificans]|uniref:Transposase n=1 Tax=Candidatus Nitrospira nitrificans TaxID=1742973 RepID=A0A0S4LCJ0_9BACT|nr:hypothetical protein COMA2_130146 [Candidatus Nitrospira nitrificans]